MTRPTLENAITAEFARQAAAAPDAADVRSRIRTHTLDAARPPRTRQSWLFPSLASATVAALAIPIVLLASRPDSTPTHRASTPPAAGSAATCAAPDLSITISRGPANLAASELARFTNTAATACTLSGYPTVVARTGTHSRTVAKQTLAGPLGGVQAHGTPPLVTLNPGGTATAMIESNDGDGVAADCETFDHLAVSVDPTSRATVTAVSMALCNLEVHPYVAGFSGTDQPPTTVGNPQAAALYVHCGVKYANFGGRTWKIAAPVPLWRRVPVNGVITEDGYIRGTMTLADRTTLIFTIHDPGVAPTGARFTFHPTQERPPVCL